MSSIAYVSKAPKCDFCQEARFATIPRGPEASPAVVDGATHGGPWAFMCDEHFIDNGRGLGTGLGQRLVVGEPPAE